MDLKIESWLTRYKNERRVELAYEQHRYYDVRRWMMGADAYTDAKGVNVTGTKNPDGSITARVYSVITSQAGVWNPRFYMLPIKLHEINRNGKLIQNPLY